MTVATLLDRLEGVRQTGSGRWIALCPAHPDRSPSLSIRELDDGRVLLHDFGGCDPGDVLGAIGLTMGALYPEPLEITRQGGGYAPSHARIPAVDLLEILDHEIQVSYFIFCDVSSGRCELTPELLERVALAARRVGVARDAVIPARIQGGRHSGRNDR